MQQRGVNENMIAYEGGMLHDVCYKTDCGDAVLDVTLGAFCYCLVIPTEIGNITANEPGTRAHHPAASYIHMLTSKKYRELSIQ